MYALLKASPLLDADRAVIVARASGDTRDLRVVALP